MYFDMLFEGETIHVIKEMCVNTYSLFRVFFYYSRRLFHRGRHNNNDEAVITVFGMMDDQVEDSATETLSTN